MSMSLRWKINQTCPTVPGKKPDPRGANKTTLSPSLRSKKPHVIAASIFCVAELWQMGRKAGKYFIGLITSVEMLGPTPANYESFTGLAIAAVPIARNRQSARSLIGLMLGMIWAHEVAGVKRDLAGTQGRADRMYERYLTMFNSLVRIYGLKPRAGATGMPYYPAGPPGPPGGGNDRSTTNNPGPFFPSGSGGSGRSGRMGRTNQTSNSQYSATGRGYSLQHREQMRPHHGLLVGSRGVHLSRAFESGADLAVLVDLSLLLASPTVPDAPMDLKIIKCVPIAGCLGGLPTLPDANHASIFPRLNHISDLKKPSPSELIFSPNFRIVKYSFVVEGATLACLAGIISTLCIAFHTECRSSAMLILDVGDSSGSNNAYRNFGEESPGNFDNGNSSSSRSRCLMSKSYSHRCLIVIFISTGVRMAHVLYNNQNAKHNIQKNTGSSSMLKKAHHPEWCIRRNSGVHPGQTTQSNLSVFWYHGDDFQRFINSLFCPLVVVMGGIYIPLLTINFWVSLSTVTLFDIPE
ncbi:hypothetical protein DFH07DRAFT_975414 [Mycena maculata]|uniref:Uncharacterized protein n=1 Tax=Mycena maculata TaxID=230809 RepID=A0AAD7P297_9AGAR|nr:hypothetical protein DFH07DRAFT_975414 [Mycena maculata]